MSAAARRSVALPFIVSLDETAPLLLHEMGNAMALLELATDEAFAGDALMRTDAVAGLAMLRRVVAQLELLTGEYRGAPTRVQVPKVVGALTRASRWEERFVVGELPEGAWICDVLALELAVGTLFRAQCEDSTRPIEIEASVRARMYALTAVAPLGGARGRVAAALGHRVALEHRGSFDLLDGMGGWTLQLPVADGR